MRIGNEQKEPHNEHDMVSSSVENFFKHPSSTFGAEGFKNSFFKMFFSFYLGYASFSLLKPKFVMMECKDHFAE